MSASAETSTPLTALILAAGIGTRMKSARPKVLHPLAGRPMIRHLLATIASLGPERAVVVVGPEMRDVEAAVAPLPSIVQARPLGTGDAVKAATDALPELGGTVLVVYGDSPGSKLDKALQLDIATLDENAFLKMIDPSVQSE